MQLLLYLSENTTSGQLDLLHLVEEIRAVQRHTGNQLPMLVDENIFYRLLKFMHGTSTREFDCRLWMSSLPLLYGVWHPYKYCLLSVYRAFFPLFALLETTDIAEDRVINGKRRILHIEKSVASLLLLRHKNSELASNALRGDAAACSTTHSDTFLAESENVCDTSTVRICQKHMF